MGIKSTLFSSLLISPYYEDTIVKSRLQLPCQDQQYRLIYLGIRLTLPQNDVASRRIPITRQRETLARRAVNDHCQPQPNPTQPVLDEKTLVLISRASTKIVHHGCRPHHISNGR